MPRAPVKASTPSLPARARGRTQHLDPDKMALKIHERLTKSVLIHDFLIDGHPWGTLGQLLPNRGQQQSQIRIADSRSVNNEFRFQIDHCRHNRLREWSSRLLS